MVDLRRIAATSTAPNKEQSLRDIDEAQKSGVGMFELRLDYWATARIEEKDLQELIYPGGMPKIITLRHKSQADPSQPNAGFKGAEFERLALLRYALRSLNAWPDIEKEFADELLKTYSQVTGVILSHHNFKETPENLEETCEEMIGRINKINGDSMAKAATRANSYDDVLRMLKLVSRYEGKLIGICMGEKGVLTRILGLVYGAPLTFGALSESRSTASGQLTVPVLKEKIELASRYYNEGIILPPSQLTRAHLEEYSKLLKL